MNIVEKINLSECFGCGSCEKKCPTDAISILPNEEGFLYPFVNIEKCINCEKCLRHCPLLDNENQRNSIQDVKTLILKDVNILSKSASGGVFAGLATALIKDGGVVYGCVYDENFNAIQKRCESLDELHLLQGSKYVFSSSENTFFEVEQDLKNGREVIYCSRPCQIAGLRAYLGKEYQNLFLFDLVCHGVPSQKLFSKYINWLQIKYNGKMSYYNFRDKQNGGWSVDGMCVIQKTRKFLKKNIFNINDPYYSAFLRDETFRESCYICPYSSPQRIGDLSLCDFWGIKNYYPNINVSKGVSACLINSTKGKNLLSKYIDLFNVYECDINKVIKHNHNLREPSHRPSIRDSIYNDINMQDEKKYFKSFIYKNKLFLIVYRCKGMIAKLLPSKVKVFIRGLKND